MNEIITTIQQFAGENPLLWQVISIAGILILAIVTYLVTHHYVLRFISHLVKKSKTEIDDLVFDEKIMRRASYLPPLLILYNFAYLIPSFEEIIHRIAVAFMILFSILIVSGFLSRLNLFYNKTKLAQNRPIKSYIQVINLFIYIIGIIIIISTLIGQSPWFLLTGLGAMTAVLILVFRDTILSFVASLQISSNDLVRQGDWIEVPAFGADGDVLDIALHTIKVQNWDKTITVIPTHKLIEVSFKNWRGMQVTGGRRIKRSLYIDQNSIKICDAELIEKFKDFKLIHKYIEQKLTELEEYNKTHGYDGSRLVNGRRLTNIGTFRVYIESYIKQHEKIHHGLTTMVRQLAPGAHGLPLEIYAFTNTTAWLEYEEIQSNIFDHILAVVPEFELKIFQNPTGKDFTQLGVDSRQ
jgi:miniconductance mechanosensitive channel